jgi:prepilin-type N-terminal cleavage/methylation domain-containing protein
MMKQALRRVERHGGFTLVEVLAALAITSVIIGATVALTHNVALYFDRGTRGVAEGERLLLAVERLAADIGSARFAWRATEAGSALAFTGEPGTGEEPAKLIFVTAGASAKDQHGDEVVGLSIEQQGELTRLVRRRAAWWGPRTRFEDLTLGDPVILLEGKFLMSFDFGRVTRDAVAWNDSWKDQPTLPRIVRFILRDRASGADLLAGNEFLVRADASGGCAQQGASGCVGRVTQAAQEPR